VLFFLNFFLQYPPHLPTDSRLMFCKKKTYGKRFYFHLILFLRVYCSVHLPTDSSLMFCKENIREKGLIHQECVIFFLNFFLRVFCSVHLPTDSSLMFCKENIWKKRLLSSVLTAGNHLSIYPTPRTDKKNRERIVHIFVSSKFTLKSQT
jgi:hypothetical protein